MKKITFILLIITVSFGYSQKTISFESSEGFSIGDLVGQNNWTVTSCGPDCFIENQAISNDYASDGSQSLKISPDPNFGNSFGIIFGGFNALTDAVSYADATISYDIYATELDASDFRFGAVGEDNAGDLFFVFLVDFDYQGNIKIINSDGSALQTIGSWAANTWYNIRAEITGSSVTYFIDNVEAATSNLASNLDITEIRFVHDNFGGDGYMDNIRINDELVLNTSDVLENSFSHYMDNEKNRLIINSPEESINSVEIFSLLGQSVFSKSESFENIEDIDLLTLNDGVYLAKVKLNSGIKSFKFVKH